MSWSNYFDYEYLTPQQLAGFENYKYSAVDTNPLSIYMMHPFWNHIVKYCPMWLAPNMLTFVGFLMMAFACFLLSYYDYHYWASSGNIGTVPIPAWVFLAVSILIFVSYTLDGIDGKQARRTGTCGPLGELFDHGLDSWTAVLIPVCLYSIFSRSEPSIQPFRFYMICWNVFLTFYTTHWEKYLTGVLFLPWGYDLSMLGTTVLFAVTFFTGHEGWKITVFEGISTGRLIEILFYMTSFLATLPVSMCNIYRSYRDGTGKNLPLTEAIRPLVPVGALLILSVAWVLLSPTDIISTHPRALYLMTGTVFSNITCRLVVSQMSRTRCFAWNSLLTFEAITFAVSVIVPATELVSLYFLWLVSTLCHIHYGTCVVRQMCRHFRIKCFKITKREE